MIRWLIQLVQRGRFLQDSNQRSGVNLADRPLEDWHQPFLEEILKGSCASVEFFRILHGQGVWLSRNCAHSLAQHCHQFVSSYEKLANMCHARCFRRFLLEPSLHYFHHFAIDITHRLRKGDRYILTPNQDNCECDEDFVGRLARLSRSTHANTTNLRTLQRYRIKVWFVLHGEDWGASHVRRRKPKLKRVRQTRRGD
eukprot:Skav210373  [mRNA]  locus=scaffold1357:670957:671550:- [translate_table: standard]